MSNKNITNDEVRHIAKLAKLKIGDDELDRYAQEMDKILEYFSSAYNGKRGKCKSCNTDFPLE